MSDPIRLLANDDPNDEDDWSGTVEVLNAAAGITADGRRLIVVRYKGTDVTCSYGNWYTPVVGDFSTYIKNGPSMFVLGPAARA